MSSGDVMECESQGRTPLQSLAMGLILGPSWSVCREKDGDTLGAFGCVPSGSTIWSLWTETLTWQEQAAICRSTKGWVEGMVSLCGHQLHNWVDIENHRAVQWLEVTGAFVLHHRELDQRGGRTFMRFETHV